MPRDLPPLNALRAFESAAQHLNFTKASEELFVTQGAVSRQIKRLEEDLGLPLFRRDGPKIVLTPVGAMYRDAIIEGLSVIRRGTAKVRQQSARPTLTVSVLPSFATMWLVPRVVRFHAEHPHLELRLNCSYDLVDFRHEPEIDAAIRFGRGDWPGVYSECLFSCEVFPVCSPALLNGNGAFKSTAEIYDHPLIHATEPMDDWSRWFDAAGLELPDRPPGTRYSDFMALQQAAIEGQGVALARSLLVEADLRSGRLIKPIDISIRTESSYYFVCSPEMRESETVNTLYRWLKQEAGAACMNDHADRSE